MRFRTAGLAFGVVAAVSAYGQYVISAHSGIVHSVDGQAFLDNKQVEPKFGQYPEIKENQEFRTEDGRAEVLLTPGVFLRMGQSSAIRMVSNQLTDTRVEILKGSVMVECEDIPKDNSIMLLYKDSTMLLVKHGLYRVETDPAKFQVYDGEAIVKGASGQLTLKGGKQTALDGVLMATNFDKKDTDALYNWSSRRASYLAKANVSSAMGLTNSSWTSSGWYWNSLFGLYTFVPYRGTFYSPFGYGFWSPYTVVYYYNPGYAYNNGGGAYSRSTPTFTPYSSSQLGYATVGRSSSAGSTYSGGTSSGGSASGGMTGGGGASMGGGATRGGGAGSAGGGAGRGR